MKGDFTRLTFDPKKHYSSVRMQQGRVQLDSDWNEQMDIEAYLRETSLTDVIGCCGVPQAGYELKTGGGWFQIGVTDDGEDLIIFPGRIYVDGILCELEDKVIEIVGPDGNGKQIQLAPGERRHLELQRGARLELLDDALQHSKYLKVAEILESSIQLEEVVQSSEIKNRRLRRLTTLTMQPYLPLGLDAMGKLLPEQKVGTYFVYLDVWRRHITALEHESIREKALGGPDTATRLQTVWQVKLFPIGRKNDSITCASKPTEWTDHIAQPSGTLRARTRPADDPKTPCIVPASAHYTRLENQLYRVEVHKSGAFPWSEPKDAPTFKWSRENGSVVTRWSSKDHKIEVESTGRDKVLAIEKGSWIELTDDSHELSGEPGLMAQVDIIEGNELTLMPAPDSKELAKFAGNCKVARRWDSAGDLPIMQSAPNENKEGYLPLEGGIEIRFEAGTYRTGDYWLIPARAFIGQFQGDIEWPKENGGPAALEPHGIKHHYCKLAVVEINARGGFEVKYDCRNKFLPLTEIETPDEDDGCCELVVRPGQSIQDAIDSLTEGGAICLKTGEYKIDKAIEITGSNITLHGCPGAVVWSDQVPLVEASGANHVTIEGIWFKAGGDSGGALIDLKGCDDFSLRHCSLIVDAVKESKLQVAAATGVHISGGKVVEIRGNEMEGMTLAIVAEDDVSMLSISENTLLSPAEIRESIGIYIRSYSGSGHRIESNHIENFEMGVRLVEERPGEKSSTIEGNEIVRNDARGGDGAEQLFAIDVVADQCTIRENRINLPSQYYGGIQVIGSEARIEENVIDSSVGDGRAPFGILLGGGETNDQLASFGRIRGNRLTGYQNAISVSCSPGVEIINNWIEGKDGHEDPPDWGLFLLNADESRVAGNRIAHAKFAVKVIGGQGIRLLDNELQDGTFGFTVGGTIDLEVSRNRVEIMKGWGFLASALQDTISLYGNRFAFCVYAHEQAIKELDEVVGSEQVLESVGWFAVGVFNSGGEVQIDGCEIVDTGVAPDRRSVCSSSAVFGIQVAFVRGCRIHGNLVGYSSQTMPNGELGHRAIFLRGLFESSGERSGNRDEISQGGSALVLDNKLRGPGVPYLVEIDVMGSPRYPGSARIEFSNNDCLHWTSLRGDGEEATVFLMDGGTVMGNHLRSSERRIPSVNFNNNRGVFMGNWVSEEAIHCKSCIPHWPQLKFNFIY